jgi:uncharacterized protein YndB with AHSA1/START domain
MWFMQARFPVASPLARAVLIRAEDWYTCTHSRRTRQAPAAQPLPMAKAKPYKLEYIIKSSPTILYGFLTTPAGLTQWFADEVDINGDTYTFVWNDSPEEADLIEDIENELVRFRWDYSDPDEYFEFRIEKSEVTGDTILYITDFAEDSDAEDQRILWDSQIANLIKRLGGS